MTFARGITLVITGASLLYLLSWALSSSTPANHPGQPTGTLPVLSFYSNVAEPLRRPAPAVNTGRGSNLILTWASGKDYAGNLGKEWVARFGGSLRRSGSDADVVFFTERVDPAILPIVKAARFRNQTIDPDPNNHPWASLHIYSRRWHDYRLFLEAHAAEYEGSFVFVLDARDCYFQRDPFTIDIGNASLAVFLEGVKIATEKFNAGWMRVCYGDAQVKAFASLYVTCAGTIYGTYRGVIAYMKAQESQTLAESTACRASFGHDQGHHNFIVYSGLLQDQLAAAGLGGLRIYNNSHGPVQTLGAKGCCKLSFDAHGRVVNQRGDVAHVLHQFDRWKGLAAQIRAMNPVSAPFTYTGPGQVNLR
jgi:hypothetical protein